MSMQSSAGQNEPPGTPSLYLSASLAFAPTLHPCNDSLILEWKDSSLVKVLQSDAFRQKIKSGRGGGFSAIALPISRIQTLSGSKPAVSSWAFWHYWCCVVWDSTYLILLKYHEIWLFQVLGIGQCLVVLRPDRLTSVFARALRYKVENPRAPAGEKCFKNRWRSYKLISKVHHQPVSVEEEENKEVFFRISLWNLLNNLGTLHLEVEVLQPKL